MTCSPVVVQSPSSSRGWCVSQRANLLAFTKKKLSSSDNDKQRTSTMPLAVEVRNGRPKTGRPNAARRPTSRRLCLIVSSTTQVFEVHLSNVVCRRQLQHRPRSSSNNNKINSRCLLCAVEQSSGRGRCRVDTSYPVKAHVPNSHSTSNQTVACFGSRGMCGVPIASTPNQTVACWQPQMRWGKLISRSAAFCSKVNNSRC